MEYILGLFVSRLLQQGNVLESDQIIQDIETILISVRFLKEHYQDKIVIFDTGGENTNLLESSSCPVENRGGAYRPRYAIDKDLVQSLRKECYKWVDIARILNISSKTLLR